MWQTLGPKGSTQDCSGRSLSGAGQRSPREEVSGYRSSCIAASPSEQGCGFAGLVSLLYLAWGG